MSQTARFAVIGAGSFGTSLAMLLARNGLPTTLWGRDPASIEACQQARCNERYLPGHPFPEQLQLTHSLEHAVAAATHVLIVVPSHACADILARLAALGMQDKQIVWASKGFEPGSGRLLHEVVAEVLGTDTGAAVLSGPTFAREVAANLPTAVTVAARSSAVAGELAALFHKQNFRVYTSTDVEGVQVGGGVKNVLALAAGIADGLGFGANSRAALITRGLAELMRLGVALGGRRETFMGLTGIGDLVLTCTDDQSRNRRAGLLLGQGVSLAEAQQRIGQVVEGVRTAPEVVRMARRLGVEMPISEQVQNVLHGGLEPREAVRLLLERAPGSEH